MTRLISMLALLQHLDAAHLGWRRATIAQARGGATTRYSERVSKAIEPGVYDVL